MARLVLVALLLVVAPSWALRPVSRPLPVGLTVREAQVLGARVVTASADRSRHVSVHAPVDRPARLRDVARGSLVACTGTFHGPDLRPLGLVVEGARRWTPTQVRRRGDVVTPVASLPRWFLAVREDGSVGTGDAAGRSARQVLAGLAGGPVRSLLGGAGPLVQGGRPVDLQQMLVRPGFDARSGVDAFAARPRVAVGRDGEGRLLLAACDRPGLRLPEFAAILAAQGASEALFLDGGRTAGLSLPAQGLVVGSDDNAHSTFLVVR